MSKYNQPILLGSRRSPLQGVLIQPTLISEETAGGDGLHSALGGLRASASDMGWYAPITAQPFGNMHLKGCGCEGCIQSGRMGADVDQDEEWEESDNIASGLSLLKWAMILGASFYFYRELKKSKDSIKAHADKVRKAAIAGLQAF